MNLTSEQYGCYTLCCADAHSLKEALRNRNRNIFSYPAGFVAAVWNKTKNWPRINHRKNYSNVESLVNELQSNGLGFVAKETLKEMVEKTLTTARINFKI